MATQNDLVIQLQAVLAQLQKAAVEIAALRVSNGTSGDASEALSVAVSAVEAQTKIVDDLIPDLAVKNR